MHLCSLNGFSVRFGLVLLNERRFMGLCSIFWSTLCLYCQYVVRDFEFSRCVCIVSMLCLILNFLGLCLILNFFFCSNFEFFQGKKNPEIFFLFLKKPIAAFLKCSYRRL